MNVRISWGGWGVKCQYNAQKWRRHLKEVGYRSKKFNYKTAGFDEEHSDRVYGLCKAVPLGK